MNTFHIIAINDKAKRVVRLTAFATDRASAEIIYSKRSGLGPCRQMICPAESIAPGGVLRGKVLSGYDFTKVDA